MSEYPKIVVTPPGPKARELAKLDEKVISQSFIRFYPLAIQSGKGCIIRDVDGNELIDFNSGLVCLNVGHSHPKVVKAIKAQTERFLHYSVTDFMYREVVDTAEKLVKITPGHWEKKVFFCNSGAEAVEAGAKLARWHTRKQLYIAFIGAFHGRTFGGMSFTASKPVQRRHFFPLVPAVTHVPYGYCYRCPFHLTYPDCRYWCIDFIDEQVLDSFPLNTFLVLFRPVLFGKIMGQFYKGVVHRCLGPWDGVHERPRGHTHIAVIGLLGDEDGKPSGGVMGAHELDAFEDFFGRLEKDGSMCCSS